jgi:hypothetical protein
VVDVDDDRCVGLRRKVEVQPVRRIGSVGEVAQDLARGRGDISGGQGVGVRVDPQVAGPRVGHDGRSGEHERRLARGRGRNHDAFCPELGVGRISDLGGARHVRRRTTGDDAG